MSSRQDWRGRPASLSEFHSELLAAVLPPTGTGFEVTPNDGCGFGGVVRSHLVVPGDLQVVLKEALLGHLPVRGVICPTTKT